MSSPSSSASPPRDPYAPFVDAVVEGLVRSASLAGLTLSADTVRTQLDLDGGPEGDAAFPAHRMAQAVRRAPGEIAAALAEAFPQSPLVASIHAKGAYVNFVADARWLTETTLGLALSLGPVYGHGTGIPGSACVEHTSANPTGPFHVGRVRNAIIGDTLARVSRAAGSQVTTQYYVDDMGRQATMITWIWSKPRESWPAAVRATVEGKETPDEKGDLHFGRPYPAVSALLKENGEAREEVAALIREIEAGRAPPEHRRLAETILHGMLASLARLQVHFDEFVWESDLVRDGSVERVLARLRRAPHAVEEENGAWAIDTTTYGLPKESTHVVFQRGDGTSLYVTRDVAYHLAKFGRFDRVVDVLGQDHQLHARTLDALLAEVGEVRRPEFLIYQDITVPEGGRMSTRGGSAVWLDDLLAEAVDRARKEVLIRREDLDESAVEAIAEAVATGALRFHILRVAPEKPVVFRWEDALSFEGRSGPFLQYSYARASSVLRKGEAARPPYPFDAAQLTHPEERALVRILSRFPRTVAYAARTGHVHAVAGYAHDLADQFNRFYHAVPVLRSTGERASRIALVAAMRQTLGNALDLLGVVPLDAM
ncbi:MAG: arginine--tRNA ligase [Thermoplasmata archaeon]